MITKNELKYYSSLVKKKYRKLEGRFIVEGEKNVLDGLNSKIKCDKIFCTNSFKENNEELIKKLRSKNFIEIIRPQDFEKLSDTVTPQEIVGIFFMPAATFDVNKKYKNTLIFLENISDPGNLGTIIRTCDWFGFNEILLSNDCADLFNSKALRSTAGSIFNISAYESIELNVLKNLKDRGYKIVTADLTGENLYKFQFERKNIIAFCNEGSGPSEELLKLSNAQITIPKNGQAESLNVAIAAAIILSSAARIKS